MSKPEKIPCEWCMKTAKYECDYCGMTYCKKHASEFDYECIDCEPPRLVPINEET